MFGYFRFKNQYSPYSIQKIYKNYYCGLCFALERHYGQLSRMLLSYDVTTIAIIGAIHKEPCCDKITCAGCNQRKRMLFDDDLWKKTAGINILLAAEKLQDDINDENSFLSKIERLLFHNVIKKAQKDRPETLDIIKRGYKTIVEDEVKKADVIEIGKHFADMMLEVADSNYNLPQDKRLFVYEISRWLYYIDALDDYDEDVRKKRFNPLIMDNVTFKDYTEKYYSVIQRDLSDIFKNFEKLKLSFSDESPENQILRSFLINTIPSVTASVLKRQKLPKLLHFKKGNVWTGDTE